MRPLDRLARTLALTLPSSFVYGPDALYGFSAIDVFDPAKMLTAGLGTLAAVSFHIYDCRARARAARAEQERAEAERDRLAAEALRAIGEEPVTREVAGRR